ncbi:Helix-turn-helix domain (DUF4817) [Popillia japonica]|uniref:Helix-turn-helix domain (DUF4817) n=1 Tax=Popillia japonica TaxID=7064 RepID=A0AAW1LCT2_POPJA
MPFTYDPNEYVDMLLIYGERRKSSREAANLYRERFPERSHPAHTTFNKELKLRTGSFPCNVKHANHNAPARNAENVINVLAYVALFNMPFTYDPNEYVDMLSIYGECRKNSREAANLYRERFPERSHPAHTTFNKLELKLRTSSFPSNVKHANHNAPARNEENDFWQKKLELVRIQYIEF